MEPEKKRGANATKCPLSRAAVMEKAPKVLNIRLEHEGDGGKAIAPQAAVLREFSSGSLGWYAGEKITLMIDGMPVKCQVGVNITIVGSKDLPKSETAEGSV
jgi:hypothetical protein